MQPLPSKFCPQLLLEAKNEQEGLDAISHLAKELALGVREGR